MPIYGLLYHGHCKCNQYVTVLHQIYCRTVALRCSRGAVGVQYGRSVVSSVVRGVSICRTAQ